MNEKFVSKETVEPRRWQSETIKFGIKEVDKRQEEKLTLEMLASLSLHGGNLNLNHFFKYKIYMIVNVESVPSRPT